MAEGRRCWGTRRGLSNAAAPFCFNPRLVDKDKARSVDPALMDLPAPPFTGDNGSILLGRQKRF
jgi:hypothetical protein